MCLLCTIYGSNSFVIHRSEGYVTQCIHVAQLFFKNIRGLQQRNALYHGVSTQAIPVAHELAGSNQWLQTTEGL